MDNQHVINQLLDKFAGSESLEEKKDILEELMAVDPKNNNYPLMMRKIEALMEIEKNMDPQMEELLSSLGSADWAEAFAYTGTYTNPYPEKYYATYYVTPPPAPITP